MKGIVLLNGEAYCGKIDCENALVYCCDGAYAWAKGKVRIDKNLGDFDSLSETPFPLPEEIYPSEKNFTDGEIAVIKLIEKGVSEIEIYGGFGGREDHFLGNIHLLYRAFKAGVNCRMIGDRSIIFPATGRVALDGVRGSTLSVLPFGGVLHIIDSAGLKYAYPESISYGECRGISNVAVEDTAHVTVNGVALVIINRGQV